MKIDQLPVEIVMKIFGCLPTYAEISLVNKLFYSVACKVNDSNIGLRIDQRFCERFLIDNTTSSEWLQSMQLSNRRISKVEIEISSIHRRIVSVIETFSSTIKCLKLASVTMDESTFLEILSLTPNIQQLDLLLLHSYPEYQPSKTRRSNNDDLILEKLKTLSIGGCDDKFVRVFCRLPTGVLTELRVNYFYWNTLTNVLNRQLKLKKLSLEGIEMNVTTPAMDIFDKLKLESLELEAHKLNNDALPAILTSQAKLKSLILYGLTVVDVRTMNAISDLSELEILSMNIKKTPRTSIEKIRRLKNLQDLTIRCYNSESTAKLKALSESDNLPIKKLSLDLDTGLSVDVIAALATSAPHLTHFSVSSSRVFNGSELDVIMRCFNFVEILEIPMWDERSVDLSNYFNPKLRELSIYIIGRNQCLQQWLSKLSVAYPNLTKLKVSARTSKITLEMQPLLNGSITKLESLVIRAWFLYVSDLDYLRDHKGNLKFVELGGLGSLGTILTDDFVKKLRANFGLASVDNSGCLRMAIDRHTMNCERKEDRYYELD